MYAILAMQRYNFFYNMKNVSENKIIYFRKKNISCHPVPHAAQKRMKKQKIFIVDNAFYHYLCTAFKENASAELAQLVEQLIRNE